jgi:predicted extracellular nuclease
MPAEKTRSPAILAAVVGVFLVVACAALLGNRQVAIPEIQGSGHFSRFADEEVTTGGVVTAVVPTGFYLQDPRGDGDPGTSDGIFVFTGRDGEKPDTGDEIEVSGVVSEYVPGGSDTGNLSTTQLSRVSFEVLSSGSPLPDPSVIGAGGRIPPNVHIISESELPVDLSIREEADANPFNPNVDGIDFYESLESMRVTVQQAVAISAIRRINSSIGEVWVLPDNGANVAPGDARTGRGGIHLQPHPDNRGDQHPERVQIQFNRGLYPTDNPLITVGDRLGDVEGIMGYGFGNFEVYATESVDISASGLRPEITRLIGSVDAVTIATYNVLNLTPLSSSDAQRSSIARHIVHNMRAPDIIALQEIQDNNGTEGGAENSETDASVTLNTLTDAVAAAGGPRYESFDVAPAPNSSGGAPGGNIRNAYLYNPARVRLVSFTSLTPAVLTESKVSDPTAFTGSRDPLLATFEILGAEFTVICNHLSSRFGSTPLFGAFQPFVQAGEDNRESQTRALNEYVAGLLEHDANRRVIVLGDMNTFDFTRHLTQVLPGTSDEILHNLIPNADRDERYTYIFEGNSQVLDHIFVTPALLSGAEIDIVHVNVDFPRVDSRVASDHEPVVARLRVP